MRIVGGTLKGRSIATPKGTGTRPTSDRAREGIFNILAHAPWAVEIDDARVLDVFAGSGALGFEALSRGASFCLFVDTDAAARGTIRTNAEQFNLIGTTRIHRRGATQLGTKPAGVGAPFNLVFLDAPYRKDFTAPALSALRDGGWLADNATLMAEIAHDEEFTPPQGFTEHDRRRYGEACAVFLSANQTSGG